MLIKLTEAPPPIGGDTVRDIDSNHIEIKVSK